MNKEEAIDIVRDAGFGFFATVEGNKPHVRPMMPYLSDDGELLLALLGRSRTIPQIKSNPNGEICFVDRKMWYCRVSGTAVISSDISKKKIVFENVPMLRQYFAFRLRLVKLFHDAGVPMLAGTDSGGAGM